MKCSLCQDGAVAACEHNGPIEGMDWIAADSRRRSRSRGVGVEKQEQQQQ